MEKTTNLWAWIGAMKMRYGTGKAILVTTLNCYYFGLKESYHVDPDFFGDTGDDEEILVYTTESLKPEEEGQEYSLHYFTRAEAIQKKITVDENTFHENRVLR